MAVFNEPTQWDHELGNNADVSTLPDDTGATTGVASLQKLFQLINQTPLEAGGVAPSREDFNALFKFLGDSIFYMQNGGLWSYNSDFDYVVGRLILFTDGNIYKCIQANGASSTVVAPDSVDPVGTDYWELLLTSSVLSSFANTDLSNLSATGQAIIDGKADKDFSNVTTPTQAFKNMSVGWGMPDYSSGVVLSVSAGQTWTAPENCFISVMCDQTSNVLLKLNNNSGEWITYQVTTSSNASSNLIPIEKGTIIYVQNFSYSGTSLTKITYYPCKGAN